MPEEVCRRFWDYALQTHLCRLVLARSDEVSPVSAHLQVRDDALVGRDAALLELRVHARLRLLSVVVVEGHLSVLVSRHNVLVAGAPASDGGLWPREGDCPGGFLGLASPRCCVAVDGESSEGSPVAHACLGDGEDLGTVLGPGDALNSGGELPLVELLSGSDIPEAERVVGGASDEERRGGCIRAHG